MLQEDFIAQIKKFDQPFHVICIGSGVGIYAFTRAFYDRFGIVSVIVGKGDLHGALKNSRTAIPLILPSDTSDKKLQAVLNEIATALPGESKILLLANTDSEIEFISRSKNVLDERYELRVPDLEIVERVEDKAEFAQLCEKLDVATPHTEILDFRNGDRPGLSAFPLEFPVVAKPAVALPHVQLKMAGKKKVYFLQSFEELENLVGKLHEAGFRDRFVVQPLIPGDDTAMKIINVYRSARGVTTLRASGEVVLQEHTPDALGRPATIVSTRLPEELEQAKRFLDAIDYVGFANFDLKTDPSSGKHYFLELNPRIGRSNYYITASGVNVGEVIANDAIYARDIDLTDQLKPVLYTLIPKFYLKKYLSDPELRGRFRAAAKNGVYNPWHNRKDSLYVFQYYITSGLNQIRKLRKFYPKQTETGF